MRPHGSRAADAPHSVSMADVARVAGVSQQTVSRVVNDQANVKAATRERVLAAMEELGFRPNYAGRSLRGGSYRAVGLFMPDLMYAGNLATLNGLMAAAAERGYAVTLADRTDAVERSLARESRQMAALPVDGIVINMSQKTADFDEFVPLPGLKTVIVGALPHPRCTTVDSDHYGAAVMAVERLIACGHRQIRHIAGPVDSVPAEQRECAWRDVLERHGLPVVEPCHGDWSADEGYEFGRRLAKDWPATALFAANDQMAYGAMLALRERGVRVPEDLSIIGIDDSLEGVVPHNMLTTVRLNLEERGRAVFEHAVGTLAQSTEPVAVRIPGTLVTRASVADLR